MWAAPAGSPPIPVCVGPAAAIMWPDMGETEGKDPEPRFRERALRYYDRRGLLKGTRHLVYISTLALLGRTADLRDAMDWAIERRVPVRDLQEALLQTFLFAGYPRVIHAFEQLDEVLRARGLASDPVLDRLPPRSTAVAFFRRRGREVFREVYRDDTDVVMDRIRGFHPEFMEWILEEAYGKVLGRPFLDLKTRELIAAGLLTALELPRQLTPHLRGALRAGATVGQVSEAIRQLGVVLPRRAVNKALVRLDRARVTL